MPTLAELASPVTGTALIVLAEQDLGALGGRLHDGVMQDLLATRYLTDLALSASAQGSDPTVLHARLEAVREAAAAALSGGRKLLAELTARGTDGAGLAGAIRSSAAAACPGVTVLTGDAADPELGAVAPATAVVTHRLAGAWLRTLTASRTLRVWRTSAHLFMEVDAEVDLAAAEIAGWVLRAQACGGSVTVAHGTSRLVFPLYDGGADPVHGGIPPKGLS